MDVADARRSGVSGRWLDCERLPDQFDRLYRAAYALCRSREDAEDLVQEAYVRVLSRPRWVRPGGEQAYVMRVLRHVWFDTLKSRARRPELPMELEQAGSVAAGAGSDPELLLQARAAYAAIAALSAPLRETILAVDVLGLSYRETAQVLGTGEGTVMSRVYNARRKVGEAIGVRS